MPLYLQNTEGKEDFRLISASSQSVATKHFLGEPKVQSRTISDPIEGAELAAKYKLEKAGEVAAEPPKAPPPSGQDGEDEK